MAKQNRVWGAISPEDSSAVAMRSVAAALCNEFTEIEAAGAVQRHALNLLALGGKKPLLATFRRMLPSGADPAMARRVTANILAAWAVSLYAKVNGPFDAVVVGAPGGGVAHLASAMRAPFLSQHFLVNYNDPSPADDVEAYQAHGAVIAEETLVRNRDLAAINHYDPLHNRLAVQSVNQIRYKLLEIPEAYKTFITENLRPGGILIFADCRYSWPMYFISERHWFQVGGLGGLAPRDYIEGVHPKIAALQAASGSEPVGNWGLRGQTAFDMPESEWGALAPFHDRVAQFARDNAYEFVALDGAHPQFFSYLAFRVWRKLVSESGSKPQGVLLETFTQVAPAAVRAAALLPVWIPRNCSNSLGYLRRIQREFRHYPALRGKPILWMPQPTRIESFDAASWDNWLETMSGLDVHPLGMRPHLYPLDPLARYAARQELMSWVKEHPAPVDGVASLDLIMQEARVLRRQPLMYE
ncbi:MAG: hypothetical protein JXA21_05330 [Anaerolineae bacterium]|nr:hypothetical protein [Anaerolineae bacterium]